MIAKVSVVDRIEVLESGHIQVRRADIITENGVEIAKSYHRHVLAPGDDLTVEDARVVAVANAVWTPDVIAAYKARQAAATP